MRAALRWIFKNVYVFSTLFSLGTLSLRQTIFRIHVKRTRREYTTPLPDSYSDLHILRHCISLSIEITAFSFAYKLSIEFTRFHRGVLASVIFSPDQLCRKLFRNLSERTVPIYHYFRHGNLSVPIAPRVPLFVAETKLGVWKTLLFLRFCSLVDFVSSIIVWRVAV